MDLARPFRGVRVAIADGPGETSGGADGDTPTGAPERANFAGEAHARGSDLANLCLALQVRLKQDTFFSHTTAALLMGVPLPLSVEQRAPIHVTVFDPGRAPNLLKVTTHQLRPVPLGRLIWKELRVTSPALTWCLLAEELSLPDLVAAGDYLLTGIPRAGIVPFVTIEQLTDTVTSRRGRPGVRRLQQALALVRVGPLSRRESHARLLYRAAGLPEPEINWKVFNAAGDLVAILDLAWPSHRVGNEYEGRHHQDVGQFRADVLRRERVEDLKWRLVRLTVEDITVRVEETVIRMADRLGLTVSPTMLAAAVHMSRQFGR